MIEDNTKENVIGNFVKFLELNYGLPEEIINLVQSYVAVLGEPRSGDCQDGYFVEMMWDGEEDYRMLECFMYNEDTIEFIKVTLLDQERESIQEESFEDLLTLRNWLDGY